MILGLPGESKIDMLDHAIQVSKLPIDTLKIHHLQIVKHTMMAYQFKKDPNFFSFMQIDEYVDLVVDFLELLNPSIIIERFFSESPKKFIDLSKIWIEKF